MLKIVLGVIVGFVVWSILWIESRVLDFADSNDNFGRKTAN